MEKNKRSKKIRTYNALCVVVLFGSIIYLIVGGAQIVSYGLLTAAIAGTAAPVVISGEGVLEVVIGVIEAILEGVMTIIEGILSAISSIISF